MIIDAHADYSDYLVLQRRTGRNFALEQDLLPPLKQGGVTGFVNAVYVYPEDYHALRESALEQMDELAHQVNASSDFRMVTSEVELLHAHQEEKIGVFLSLEGAEPIECWEDLDLFYRRGLRFIGLTWNQANRYAGGCAQPDVPLSKLGHELLERMSDKRMILDLSHLNDQSTIQALEAYRGVVIASHSNARSQCNHRRNLPDDILRKLANQGGVTGLNVCSSFVAPGKPELNDLRNQVYALLNLVGEDHVAFGFDFCDRVSRDRGPAYDVLAGPELATDFLDSLKIPGRVKDKVAYRNWLRIYRTLNETIGN